MNDSQLRELIERVEAFEIDQGRPSLTFAQRLARENGWTVDYADRVVQQYKRFAILAVAAGHSVTPSEDVDQAWHLHLTYTRSYWERFCQDTLRKPLHHNPTEGGVAEHAKFYEWYANTLASYQRIFGQRPPVDIWPHPTQRFANAGAGRWIDPSKFWLIPKLRFRRRRWQFTFLGLTTFVLLTVVGCGPQGMRTINPFNFLGKDFLIFYISLIAIGVAASIWCRLSLPRSEEDFPVEGDGQVDSPYVIAALANGPRGVVYSGLATLVTNGHLKINETTEKAFFGLKTNQRQSLVRGTPLPSNAPEIERVLFAAADDEGNVETQQIIDAGLPIGEAYRDKLREVGLVEPDSPQDWGYRKYPGLIMGSILVMGLIKLGVGLAREKPVGFLIGLLVVTGVLTAYFFFSNRYHTSNGRQLLKRLKLHNLSLKLSSAPTERLIARDVALMTALYGAALWSNHEGALGDLHSMMRKDKVFGGAGDRGGGGCGGGGCGGGGCGGGGCGGCGG